MRGTAKLACERGSVDAYVTLTPEAPPLIQHLELKPSIPPGERLSRAAERAAALTLRWDDRFAAELFAPSLDAAAAKKQLTAHGPCQLGKPGPGDGVKKGSFHLTCIRDAQDLEIALDEASGRVAELQLRAPRDPSRKCPPT